jgi:hypothetical protein
MHLKYFYLFVKGKIISEHMFEFFMFPNIESMLSACWVIDIENDQEHISRSFDHVNIENLAIFMKEEIISRISGVNIIVVSTLKSC